MRIAYPFLIHYQNKDGRMVEDHSSVSLIKDSVG